MKRIIYILIMFLCYSKNHAIEIEEFIDPNPSDYNLFGQTVLILPNGNVMITAPNTNINGKNNCGAIYLYDGTTRNLISSLYGESTKDQIGFRDYYSNIDEYFRIINNKVIIPSPFWSNKEIVNAGAITIFDIYLGVNGYINESNSVLGSNKYQQLGFEDLIFSNNFIMVVNPYWDNGDLIDVGALHYIDLNKSILEPLSIKNSLIGVKENDKIGFYGFDILPNGNYLLYSPYYDNGEIIDAGAITWIDKNNQYAGIISEYNSIIGSFELENLGNWNTEILSNSNYLVFSPHFDFENKLKVGAVRFCNGNFSEKGVMNFNNSLIGTNASDMVGHGGIKKISGNEYFLISQFSDYKSVEDLGAFTFFNINEKLTGYLDENNSLFGTSSFINTNSQLTNIGSEYTLFTFYINPNNEDLKDSNNNLTLNYFKLKIGEHPNGIISNENSFEIKNPTISPKITIFANNNFLIYYVIKNENNECLNVFTFCDINKNFIGEPNTSNSLINISECNYLNYSNYYHMFKDSNNIFKIITYKREKDNKGLSRVIETNITLCDIRFGKFGLINETNSLIIQSKSFGFTIFNDDINKSLLYIRAEDKITNKQLFYFIPFEHNNLPKGIISEKNSIIYSSQEPMDSVFFNEYYSVGKLSKTNQYLFNLHYFTDRNEFNKLLIIDKNTKFGIINEKKVIKTNINIDYYLNYFYNMHLSYINDDYTRNSTLRILQNNSGNLFLFDTEKNIEDNTDFLYLKCYSTISENENKFISKIKLPNNISDLSYLILKNSKLLIGSNSNLNDENKTNHLSYLSIIDLNKNLDSEIGESNSIIFADTLNINVSYNNFLIRLDSNKFVYQFFNKDKNDRIFEGHKIIDLNFGVNNNIDTSNTLINYNLSKISTPSVVQINDEFLLSINRINNSTESNDGLLFKNNLFGNYENKSTISFKNNLTDGNYQGSYGNYERIKYSNIFKTLNLNELPYYRSNENNYWYYSRFIWKMNNWYNGYELNNGNIIYSNVYNVYPNFNNSNFHFFKQKDGQLKSISELNIEVNSSNQLSFFHLENNKNKYYPNNSININGTYINYGISPFPYFELKNISIHPYSNNKGVQFLPFSNNMGFDGTPDSLDFIYNRNDFNLDNYYNLTFNYDNINTYLYVSFPNTNIPKVFRIKDKEYNVNIRTIIIDSISTNRAIVKGHIKSDGGAEVLEKGFVISKSPNPTINDIKIKNFGEELIFKNNIINLESKTKYYLRAFAKNKIGFSYGEELTFETLGDETSIETKKPNFLIFPNPSSDKISVDLGEIVVGGVADLSIYDILGNEVISIPNYTNKSEIDVSTIPIGTYTIQIQTSTGSVSQRLLVNR